MTPLVLELLDDELDLAIWLEAQLLGPSLGQLVQELAALHDAELNTDLRCALDEASLERVLVKGFGCLSDGALVSLLRHPVGLIALADRIRLDGGEYWEDRAAALEEDGLRDDFSPSELVCRLRASESVLRCEPSFATASQQGRRPWTAALLACAASMLAMFGYQTWLSHPVEAPWIWSDPALFTQDFDGKAYLARLANAASSWSEGARTTDVNAVARRIAQFKHGCTLLLQDARRTDHQALGEADRMWLQARCLETVRVLDASWDTLDSGGDPAAVQRQVIDEVRRLSEDLKRYSPAPRNHV